MKITSDTKPASPEATENLKFSRLKERMNVYRIPPNFRPNTKQGHINQPFRNRSYSIIIWRSPNNGSSWHWETTLN